MYNEIERRIDFMGLTMYLYRAKKKMVEDLKHLKEVERDLHKMWEPIVSNEFPNNYYFVDKSKMTDNQRKLVNEMHDEFYVIEQKRIAIHNKLKVITDSSEKHNDDDDAVWFLKRFNTLHKYIVDNFSNGVDGCHEIPLTKDNVVQILNYLNHIVDVLTTSKNWNIPTDDSYSDNIIRAIDIFSMISREWDDDHVVLYLAF